MEFIWLDENRLINLNEIAYIRFKDASATIAFSNGDTLTVDGEELRKFKEFVSKRFNQAEAPKGSPGFKQGPRVY